MTTRVRDWIPGERERRLRQHDETVPRVRRALRLLSIEGEVTEALIECHDEGGREIPAQCHPARTPWRRHGALGALDAASTARMPDVFISADPAVNTSILIERDHIDWY